MVAIAVGTVLVTSEVGVNLWFVSGPPAVMVGLAYMASLSGVTLRPNDIRLHQLAGPLGVTFWGGRGAAFAQLVIEQHRWDLLGAVAERGALAAALMTLHVIAARRVAFAESVGLHG